MKSIDELLLDLSNQGIKLWVEEGLLRYQAPQGTFSPVIKAEIVDRKAEIIAFLQDTASSGRVQIQPAPRDRELPLSFAQQRLWFINELEPHSSTYNISGAIRLTGQLDLVSLERTLQEIIRRHEALRTNFISHNGQPIQVIHQNSSWQMTSIDLQELPTNEREEKIQQLVTGEAEKPFALDTDSLIRATLIIATETEHILLLALHHIVFDGWSMGVLIEEIALLYQAFVQGKPSPLAELEIQYVDFAVWQRQWLQGEILERQLNYWQQQLANPPVLLELPTDRPRPPVQTFRGAEQIFTIPADLTSALYSLSRQEGVTLFMTLLAAFDLLLARYTGQTDILIGSGIANRHHSQLEGLIGFFVNMLVFRTDLSGNPSFRELLGRVQSIVLPAYAYQDLPFEMLVDVLQPERTPSHSPLFQVAFFLQNAPASEIELTGLTLSTLTREHKTAKFDLTLSLEQINDELIGVWEYNTDLFNGDTIARMACHFQTLLSGIVAHPEQPITELPLLTVTEQHQLLYEWNDTCREYPQDRCIHQLFEEQVAKTPDAVAVVFEEQELTYQQLNERANQLAHYLQTLGVKPEVLVGICVERSLEMVVGLLGILKAGGAYVPLDPTYPTERLAFIIEDAQVPILITQEQLVNNLPTTQTQILLLEELWPTLLSIHPQYNPKNEVTANHLAYVIYTSGSTGTPKGVLGLHQGAVNRFNWMWKEYPFESEEICCQKTSFSFVDSVWELFGSLIKGIRTLIIPDAEVKDPYSLVQYLGSQQITRIVLVPSLLSAILETHSDLQTRLSKLKYWSVSGEVLSIDLAKRFLKSMPQSLLLNLYGSSEVSADVTACEINDKSISASIGCPIDNTQIYILDRQMQPVPIGVAGELHIGGDGLARGYLNRPDLTASKFIPNPFLPDKSARLYKTGDLARYLPDGNIEFLGRIDHQVKIRGFRIEPGEIEAALLQEPTIQQCAVIAHEDTSGSKHLVAYIVGDEELDSSKLKTSLKNKLPDYMIPNIMVHLDTLPLTPNGKLDYKALSILSTGSRLSSINIPPRDHVEFKLTELFTEIFDLKVVGIRDDFFDLGGHSLLIARLLKRIEETFCITNLPLSIIFQNRTVEQLAMALRTQSYIDCESTLLPLQPSGTLRPLFCITPIFGAGYMFKLLPDYLGSDQPFYALQSPDLYFEEAPQTQIEEMAAHYIETLTTLQSEGPYHLMGWCAGGMIAYEMAQQLLRKGEAVERLILIDTIIFETTLDRPPDYGDQAVFLERCIHLGLSDKLPMQILKKLAEEEELKVLSPHEQLNYAFEQMKEHVPLLTKSTLPSFERFVKVRQANAIAVSQYSPTPYPGSVLLIRSSEFLEIASEPTMGWGTLINKLQLETIFCKKHIEILTVPEKIAQFAAFVNTKNN
jgi:amino acid adenylation domain-containing protein